MLFFYSDSEFEHKDPDPGSFVTSEDEGVRLKWTAFLEFTQNQDVGDMTWDKVCVYTCSVLSKGQVSPFIAMFQTVLIILYSTCMCISSILSVCSPKITLP